MCLAIFKPKNEKFPALDVLQRAWKTNPHGAGLAIVENGKVKILKGFMTLEDFYTVLCEENLKALDVVIHFRWSTSGSVIPELCHPFPVSKSNADLKALSMVTDKALIHNGVMFQPKINDYSDTAIFSRYMAHAAPDNKTIREIIGNDRLAIVTGLGVNLIGDWNLIDGCVFSNLYSTAIEEETHIKEKISYKESWAFDDLRNDPYYFSEDYVGHEDLEFCPSCDSDYVEMIGVNSIACECLDCGTIFNETEFLESSRKISPRKKRA